MRLGRTSGVIDRPRARRADADRRRRRPGLGKAISQRWPALTACCVHRALGQLGVEVAPRTRTDQAGLLAGARCAISPSDAKQRLQALVDDFDITHDHAEREVVSLQAALPIADTTDAGLTSDEATRRYATREAHIRLHQQPFRVDVLRAYRTRCAVCSLREAPLLQAAHIVEDRDPRGAAAVINGIALCAIHHLAYDRNLLGIAPDGVVHIASRLLAEIDGPMLQVGLQGFHGSAIQQPRDPRDRPDPERLRVRFERFGATA
jgi:hypothetical protein